MKTYGTAKLSGDAWTVTAEPHVLMRLKRVMDCVSKRAVASVRVTHTPEHCADLDWFRQRYPLEVDPEATLVEAAQQHREMIETLDDLLTGHAPLPPFELAIPPRDYQSRAAAAYLARGSLLVADELGLGKTCTAIATFTDERTLPAVVVAPAHLCSQWKREVERFAPKLLVHEIAKSKPYPLPDYFGRGPDVLITSYHKLHGWAQVFGKYARSVVFDEVHELRRMKSMKYDGAKYVCAKTDFRLGLSATPIFNYGGEAFSIFDLLRPGSLGKKSEFEREWCRGWGANDKAPPLKNPKAFGSFVREQHLMVRRTRDEVGRELPAVTKVVQHVSAETDALDQVADHAAELARIILHQGGGLEKGAQRDAAGELDWRLRQATGIGKAPHVAAFVRILLESEGSVVLVGWHRAVYEVWATELGKHGIPWAMYTGSETTAQKDAAAQRFLSGDARVLILSLRSGAGLDGLQERSSVIVFGELDWSPAVHDQCVGRLQRDGQAKPVVSYYLVANEGSDPVVAETLGLKREQAAGIENPDGDVLERIEPAGDRMKKLAERYVGRAPVEAAS